MMRVSSLTVDFIPNVADAGVMPGIRSFLDDTAFRRASLLGTAFWGRQLEVEAGSPEQHAPALAQGRITLPDSKDFRSLSTGLARAAVLHAFAHLVYGPAQPFERGSLRPRQQILIALIEDARVEALAMKRFPGLARLWKPFVVSDQPQGTGFTWLAWRLSRALFLDDCPGDENAWVLKGVERFRQAGRRLADPLISREIGLHLAHDIGQMRLPGNEHELVRAFSYRDDNAHLWAEVETLTDDSAAAEMQREGHARSVFLVEEAGGAPLDLAEHGARNGLGGSYLASDRDPVLAYDRAPETAMTIPDSYPEWHYQLQRLRADWCQVREVDAPWGDPSSLRAVLQREQSLIQRLKAMTRTLRLERLQQIRRQKSGDEIDLNAAIDSWLGMRRGDEPDERIYFKSRPVHDGGLASLMLLDVSASTRRQLAGQASVLQSALEATLVLATMLDDLQEDFAIQGFRSNGRQQVESVPLKGFGEAHDTGVLARMAGLTGELSTRMGAALRHGLHHLQQQCAYHRLLLVITDGEPSDIDVFDPEYLVQDARDAVMGCRRAGVKVFCVSLDRRSEPDVRRIFGTGHYLVAHRLEHLVEQLPKLFLRLIRHY